MAHESNSACCWLSLLVLFLSLLVVANSSSSSSYSTIPSSSVAINVVVDRFNFTSVVFQPSDGEPLVFILGGYPSKKGQSIASVDVLYLNGTAANLTVDDMITPRGGLSAIIFTDSNNNSFVVTAGGATSINAAAFQTIEVLDLQNGKWFSGANLTCAGANPTMGVFQGGVVVLTGGFNDCPTAVEWLNTTSWTSSTQYGKFPQLISSGAFVSLNESTLLLFFESYYDYLSLSYDPEAAVWQESFSLSNLFETNNLIAPWSPPLQQLNSDFYLMDSILFAFEGYNSITCNPCAIPIVCNGTMNYVDSQFVCVSNINQPQPPSAGLECYPILPDWNSTIEMTGELGVIVTIQPTEWYILLWQGNSVVFDFSGTAVLNITEQTVWTLPGPNEDTFYYYADYSTLYELNLSNNQTLQFDGNFSLATAGDNFTVFVRMAQDNTIAAFNLLSNTIVWSSSLIADYMFYQGGYLYTLFHYSMLTQVDPLTGEVLWNYKLTYGFMGLAANGESVLLSDGYLYSTITYLHALNGTIKWSYSLEDSVNDFLLSEGRYIATSVGKQVYAFSLDGDLVWQRTFDTFPPMTLFNGLMGLIDENTFQILDTTTGNTTYSFISPLDPYVLTTNGTSSAYLFEFGTSKNSLLYLNFDVNGKLWRQLEAVSSF